MKAASINDLKQELVKLPPKKVLEVCLSLARFKKENKELLSFLLFEADNEHSYVESINNEIDGYFTELPRTTWFHTKKSLRKILRLIGKYSKYVNNKESQVELLLHFCNKMKVLSNSYPYSQTFSNLYLQQIKKLNLLIELVHEDLRFDYLQQVGQLQQ